MPAMYGGSRAAVENTCSAPVSLPAMMTRQAAIQTKYVPIIAMCAIAVAHEDAMSGPNTSLPTLSVDHRLLISTEGAPLPGGGNARLTAELLSAKNLNFICPACGGPMGGRSKEFKCRGRCGKDWRPEWERLRAQPVYTAALSILAQTRTHRILTPFNESEHSTGQRPVTRFQRKP